MVNCILHEVLKCRNCLSTFVIPENEAKKYFHSGKYGRSPLNLLWCCSDPEIVWDNGGTPCSILTVYLEKEKI